MNWNDKKGCIKDKTFLLPLGKVLYYVASMPDFLGVAYCHERQQFNSVFEDVVKVVISCVRIRKNYGFPPHADAAIDEYVQNYQDIYWEQLNECN